jgi:hypothetical protein
LLFKRSLMHSIDSPKAEANRQARNFLQENPGDGLTTAD